MKKLIFSLYYSAMVIIVLVLSVIIPFQYAEDYSIEYMNTRMHELKQERGVKYLDEKSDNVVRIFNAGSKLKKEKFREMSGLLGLLAAVVIALFTLFSSFSHSEDLVWAGVGFSILYGLGALSSECFVLILLALFIAHGIKKRQTRTRDSS